ncbi:uncharacterized protein LACBIDRAFT_317916 [Laccaria bicolor S238N-H82]|uniref:ubiquitinyl hydrolase 1 n=1 Tax=Laccaria bicolor (strain S238N-H82 / ATCC MYA-4686) TaxID=486041 RepID=B0D5I2_LACBS|nr:uncharacterized protein LACBIDRAFT_317916 [Laccaria bicolor S238N-H82]EDR09774.1 predicted protein [Laccaria bicolor S238N-H82]|eukprot:XP_001879159.1 predicted protein [Laccaria bicolor S238N-H82]
MKRYASAATPCVRRHRAVPQLLGLQVVARPVKAVVLLYPDYEGLDKENEEEDACIANEGKPQLDDTIFWIKSTAHAEPWPLFMPWPMYMQSFMASASSEPSHLVGGDLHTHKCPPQIHRPMSSHFADKTPEERAHLLETTPLFTSIHTESAESGQSPPDPNMPFHFTCFVAAPEVEFREITSGEKPVPNAEDITKSTG